MNIYGKGMKNMANPENDPIQFFAPGLPKTQGSKHGFNHAKTGKVIMLEKSSLKPWRAVVALAARTEMFGFSLLKGAVEIDVSFCFPRPKSHFRSGKFSRCLKDNAEMYPTARNIGDLDKLLRAILDAMTGVVFLDDSQVVRFACAEKRWAATPGAQIAVRPLEEGNR